MTPLTLTPLLWLLPDKVYFDLFLLQHTQISYMYKVRPCQIDIMFLRQIEFQVAPGWQAKKKKKKYEYHFKTHKNAKHTLCHTIILVSFSWQHCKSSYKMVFSLHFYTKNIVEVQQSIVFEVL